MTGAGRGLERAFAEAFGKAGASVVVNDIDEATVQETVRIIESQGLKAVGEVAAIGSTETANRLVTKAVKEFDGRTS